MIKNFPGNGILILGVLLFSAALILLAAYAESCLQGPLNVPADIDFMAYIPGKYALYRESIIDPKAAANAASQVDELNEILLCKIQGCGHLGELKPKTSYTGGVPYYLKDAKSKKHTIGMPFAEFEILWPGPYHLHVEFLGVVDKHPNVMVGPKYLIAIAVIISIIAQLTVLIILMKGQRKSLSQRKALSLLEGVEGGL